MFNSRAGGSKLWLAGRYRQRQQRLAGLLAELDPKGGPWRHEERPGAKAEEHDLNRNALLPTNAQTTFLLGMAQTNTVVMRPMIVAMMSGTAQVMLNLV